jgi:hypothetical protein
VEDLLLRVLGVRAGHEQIRLRIADQLERLVREGDRPRLLELLDQLGEHEPERNAGGIGFVVAEGVLHVDLVPEIEDGVAPQLGQLVIVRVLADGPFETELGAHVPVGVVVLRDLAVDRPDTFLHRLVRELAVRVIDDGDEHAGLLWEQPRRWKQPRRTPDATSTLLCPYWALAYRPHSG